MNNSTIEYNGTVYVFVSYGPANTVTGKKDGKFYRFNIGECIVTLRGKA